MKHLTYLILIVSVLSTGWLLGCSQSTVPAVSATDVDRMVREKRFQFVASTMYPTRGASRQLNGSADFTIKGDTLISYLPFWGVANTAPLNPEDASIHFTSYRFDYVPIKNKKGNWEITIQVPDQANTNQFTLLVFRDSSTNLTALSKFRDAVSFRGYLRNP